MTARIIAASILGAVGQLLFFWRRERFVDQVRALAAAMLSPLMLATLLVLVTLLGSKTRQQMVVSSKIELEDDCVFPSWYKRAVLWVLD